MNILGSHNYINDNRNNHIKIYINGELFARNDAVISVFDSGFLLGDGVWESIRLMNGNLVFLDEHLDRLYYGANKLSINIKYNRNELSNFIYYTLNANSMHSDVHIRLIVSRGLKKTPYQHPNANIGGCTIVIIPEYKKPNEQLQVNGLRLVTVKTRRGTPDSLDPRLNTLNKLTCITACIEADKAGADEGLMLDINGNVSTCNSTNFFIIRKKQVWTSTGQYCLSGITRQAVINILKENNISIKEKNFSITDAHTASEAFVTGTFGGIIPVKEIDGNLLSGGIRGKTTQIIQTLYKTKLKQLYPEN